MIKDILKRNFEYLNWKCNIEVNPDVLIMTVHLIMGKAKFKRIIDSKTMDKMLASKNFIKCWIEETDMEFKNLLSLGGYD